MTESPVFSGGVYLHTTASRVDGVVRADKNVSKECVGHVAWRLVDNMSNDLVNSNCCCVVQANCKFWATSSVRQVLNLSADSFIDLRPLFHFKGSFHQIEGNFFIAKVPVLLINIGIEASST